MGAPPLLGVAAGVIAGAAAGAFTGLIHVRCGVSRLLSGFVTTAICYSLSIRMLGGRSNLRISRPTLYDRWNPSNTGVADLTITLIALLLLLVLLAFAYRSRFVRILRAFGDTPWFCVTIGKNPRTYLVAGLAIANSIIAFGGAMVSQYKRICDVNMSFGVLLAGLAALVVGETVYASRSMIGHALVCVLGSFVYNLALGLFYFGLWGKEFIPSDVRLVTGLMLVVPSLIAGRLLPRYRLFSSEW